jgi:hypothetical protein
MEKDHGPQVKYHLQAADLSWEGHILLEPSSVIPDHVKLFLPPVAVLPSFKIFLNGQPPDRRIGRLAVFKIKSSPLNFSYQFYLPAIFSFNRLSELLPEVVYPAPAVYTLSLDPPPRVISLQPQDTPGVFSSTTKESFFNALISYQRIASATERCRHTNITVCCSPCFTTSVEEFLEQSLQVYDQCAQRLGDNGFQELKVFFDWVEPYQKSNQIMAWNSGGTIYLLVPGCRQMNPSLILTLTHEMIHEWNGRKIYPATRREWWFLEGVTQLLAFQMVFDRGEVTEETLLDLLTEALQEKSGLIGAQDTLAKAREIFPLPWHYSQSLRFAYRLEKLLRRTGLRNANLLSILRDLIKISSGAPFREETIVQLLGNYIDVNKLEQLLSESDPIQITSPREICFSLGQQIN